MKKYVKCNEAITDTSIVVTMYLRPIIYADFAVTDTSDVSIASAVYVDDKHKYHTDINPDRIINGPLSEYRQELTPPISDEWDGFVEDCKWLVKELGFTIIKSKRSEESKKSEYVIFYGVDDKPCGTLVYDLRISEHPFDAAFPEEFKDIALEYLQMHKVLDGSATKAGIDFQVEKVTVGSVKYDTWDRAFTRLYYLLKKIRKQVQIRNKIRNH